MLTSRFDSLSLRNLSAFLVIAFALHKCESRANILASQCGRLLSPYDAEWVCLDAEWKVGNELKVNHHPKRHLTNLLDEVNIH